MAKQRRNKSKKEEEVHVGAGPGHKAYTTHRLKNSFDSALKSARMQQKVKDPYEGWQEGAPKDAVPSDQGGAGGGAPPGGAYGSGASSFNPRDPDSVLDRTAAFATEIFDNLKKQNPDISQATARNVASEMAIDKMQSTYSNLNQYKIDTRAVRETAFGFKSTRPQSSYDKVKDQSKDKTKPKAANKEDIDKGLRARRKEISSKTSIPKSGAPRIVTDSQGKEHLISKKRGVGIRPESDEKVSKEGKDIISSKTKKRLSEGQQVSKAKVSNREFLRSAPPEEAKWIEKQQQYGGIFYGAKGNKVPGAYRKWQRYVNARQAGYEDRDNITQWLNADMRGRSTTTNPDRRDKATTDKMVKDVYTKGVYKEQGTKARDRFKSKAPSHEEFGVGIKVPGIPSTNDIKDKFPDMSDREVFEMRESAKQSVEEEILKNQRMAHEQRQNTVLGRSKSETAAGPQDRVVFFTTSTGYPAISASAQSLLGQYIIKKRKGMLYDNKMAPRAALKGEFPYATRDQHLIEAASGLSLGAQGRYGAFREMGYRAGSKKSKGYGKMLPVGSQILRDSTGQPLYDRNGNLRYTEGFTRPFDARTSNEVGLRVYLG